MQAPPPDHADEPGSAHPPGPRPRISVVAPAHNEEENVEALVREVGEALADVPGGFEFLIVDDASTDRTAAIAAELARDGRPWLRVLTLSKPASGGGNGQSVAFLHGFRATRGELVGVLDADLQNDPRDLVRMLEVMAKTGAAFVQGDRSAARREGDAWIRQVGSVVGRTFRRMILGDTIRDTGCSLRLMKREIAVALPLEFKGLHRFIPVTARQLGYEVVEMPVAHRPRAAGVPKYGAGITKRAIPGLIDCFAVRWMRSRRRAVERVTELAAGEARSVSTSSSAPEREGAAL